MMFFDPHVMAEHVCIGVKALSQTRSLKEAEVVFRDQLGQYPETRLQYVLNYFREI